MQMHSHLPCFDITPHLYDRSSSFVWRPVWMILFTPVFSSRLHSTVVHMRPLHISFVPQASNLAMVIGRVGWQKQPLTHFFSHDGSRSSHVGGHAEPQSLQCQPTGQRLSASAFAPPRSESTRTQATRTPR